MHGENLKLVSTFFKWWYFEKLKLVSVQLVNDFPTIFGKRNLILYL